MTERQREKKPFAEPDVVDERLSLPRPPDKPQNEPFADSSTFIFALDENGDFMRDKETGEYLIEGYASPVFRLSIFSEETEVLYFTLKERVPLSRAGESSITKRFFTSPEAAHAYRLMLDVAQEDARSQAMHQEAKKRKSQNPQSAEIRVKIDPAVIKEIERLEELVKYKSTLFSLPKVPSVPRKTSAPTSLTK
jgi:hypothetical protein